MARVRGILRRSVRPTAATAGPAAAAPAMAPPAFTLDEERHQIRYYGRLLDLSRYEHGLLRLLVQKPGRVFSRDELLDKVWDGGSDSFDRTVAQWVALALRGMSRAQKLALAHDMTVVEWPASWAEPKPATAAAVAPPTNRWRKTA